ncbi:class I SAM-dependent methyltransferase [Carboxylicivirga linearis]|uniref:Class I SAM-dependent methyltransferase n=1 Tax=Carboxylicivirga linearis TaxID=1628157 RepID=A0ABS5JTC9_9BACT|nr:class I SAM-dependent methyltransferase [Carboxylicivirga linearis]MBS2098166.1 class I SAM-dependent methyltransferase [Carboxylicivirga linearis]
MSDNIKSIHEFDVNLIVEYYTTVKRQGPGSPEITKKALSFVDGLTESSHIVDFGCGAGVQTMVLAQNAPGKVTGIDLFPQFVDLFNANANDLNLQDRVKGEQGSMDDLHFQEESLDLIWCEGAIYNIGFEKGLKYWQRFLKPGGYVAVSEATWFTDERPAEIQDFWMDAYPEIDTLPNKMAQMQSAGYLPIAAFMLPENCWIEHFYEPQVQAQEDYLKKHAGNNAAEDFIKNQQHETDLYYKYKQFYGYAFYIGKKL